MPARNSLPSRHANSVMSATYRWFDRSAVKSRSNRSPAGAVSRLPRRHLRRPCTPTSPHSPMSRATRLRPCRRPRLRSWPWTRGDPYVQRDVDVADLVRARRVVDVVVRQPAAGPPVETRPRDPDQLTEPLDRERPGVLEDECAAHLFVFRATYAAAFRRISRSIRKSLFSSRSRSSSARSSGSSAPGASSRAAAFTQAASEPCPIPNDFATSARDRSEPRYNATASRRNSSGYFAGRPTSGLLPLDNAQDRVSRKAGQLQGEGSTAFGIQPQRRCWRRGAVEVVSRTLGHAGLAITADIYAGVLPPAQREAADRLEAALGTG